MIRAILLAVCLALLTACSPDETPTTEKPPQSDSPRPPRSTMPANPEPNTIYAGTGGKVGNELVRLPVDASGSYVIEANLVLEAANIEDSVLSATGFLSCGDGTRFFETTTNVYDKTSEKLRLTMLYTPLSGNDECWLTLRVGRPRPTGTYVTQGLRLVGKPAITLTPTDSYVREDYRPTDISPVIEEGETLDPFLELTNVSRRSTEALVSVYLTSCTAPSGSYDRAQDRYACLPGMGQRGKTSEAEVTVYTSQWGPGSCSQAQKVWEGSLVVDFDVHHAAFWISAPIRLSPDCGPGTVTVRVKGINPLPAMVHRSGSLLRVS